MRIVLDNRSESLFSTGDSNIRVGLIVGDRVGELGNKDEGYIVGDGTTIGCVVGAYDGFTGTVANGMIVG